MRFATNSFIESVRWFTEVRTMTKIIRLRLHKPWKSVRCEGTRRWAIKARNRLRLSSTLNLQVSCAAKPNHPIASSLVPGQGDPTQDSPGSGAPYHEEKRFATAIYPASEPSKIWLNVERTTLLGQLRVDMYDATGRVLFSEWLPKKDAKFHQCFDLSVIGDGSYTFSSPMGCNGRSGRSGLVPPASRNNTQNGLSR